MQSQTVTENWACVCESKYVEPNEVYNKNNNDNKQ